MIMPVKVQTGSKIASKTMWAIRLTFQAVTKMNQNLMEN